MEDTTKPILYYGSEGNCWGMAYSLFTELFRLALPEYTLAHDNTLCHFVLSAEGSVQEITKKVPYITWSGESYPCPRRHPYPPVLDIRSFGGTNFSQGWINVPLVAVIYARFVQRKQEPFPRIGNKPYFLAYCHRNPVPLREQFFQAVRSRVGDSAHALSKCSNTSGAKGIAGDCSAEGLIDAYSNYTFVTAMENTRRPGYVTEKLINAFMSGSIPVYWGDETLAKHIFNPKAFICVVDYPNMDACIEDMIAIANDPVRLHAIQSEPMFRDNKVPPALQLCDEESPGVYYKHVADKLRAILLPLIDPSATVGVNNPMHTIDLSTL